MLKAWELSEGQIYAGETREDAIAARAEITSRPLDSDDDFGQEVKRSHVVNWEDRTWETVGEILDRMTGAGPVALGE